MTMWIRIDANIGDNPNVLKLAELRGVSAEEIVGVCVILFGKIAEHCPNGDVSEVSDAMLERWASWRHEPGSFAPDFRRLFVSDGIVEGWAKRQGKLIERAEKEKERWKRRNTAKAPQELRGDSAEESVVRNVTVRNKELSANADISPAIKRTRAPRPPMPWMGVVNGAWKAVYGGNLPSGSATLLAPVVAELGEDETARRLTAYCEKTSPDYATVRGFVSKHGAYAPQLAVDPVTGLPNARGMAVLMGRQ